MTHHVMNQMGHEFPNMIGVKAQDLDDKVRPLLPEYMTMGTSGMGNMAEMKMPIPPNSLPMRGAPTDSPAAPRPCTSPGPTTGSS